MKPAPFAYHRPETRADVIRLLAELAPHDGRILAGGQSLVPIMAFRLARPAHLIDINVVAGFDGLAARDGMLCIGARVRHAAFHRPVVDGPLGALLADVVQHVAHYPIRLRGTFCGSLAHADPAAEWCAVAATFDAGLVALSTRGERHIAAREFFRGAMETALAPTSCWPRRIRRSCRPAQGSALRNCLPPLRPSRLPLCGLLRMTFFLNAIIYLRHPELRGAKPRASYGKSCSWRAIGPPKPSISASVGGRLAPCCNCVPGVLPLLRVRDD